MNPNQDIINARNSGNARQAQLDEQSRVSQGQYNQAYDRAQGAGSDLQDYTRKIAGLNYGNIYNQDLTNAQSKYGFDPKSLALANRNLLNTQTAMQYAPQSSTQAGNYYGGTAGQAMSAYQNMAGNLNTTLGNQANAVGQYKDLLSATQNEANQQTTQQLAGQAQALGGYEAVAQNYTNIAQNASQTMTTIEKMAQDQGTITANQITAYQNAYSNYITAQAAASQAGSAALLARSGSNAQNLSTIQTAIGAHPNATNAQLAALTGQPESVIAGIRPYGGQKNKNNQNNQNNQNNNLSVVEGSNPGTITRVIR